MATHFGFAPIDKVITNIFVPIQIMILKETNGNHGHYFYINSHEVNEDTYIRALKLITLPSNSE
jgi:hypothetical protein